jgi:dihydroxyacetone kinase-like protein
MALSAAMVARRWLELGAERIEQEAPRLTALDAAIGDGDHGINLHRGFAAIREGLATPEESDGPVHSGGDLLVQAGRTLVSTVGGASGPLYGTFFIALGTELGDANELAAEPFGVAFEAAVAAVARRGRSTTGEKTLLDALVPAASAWRESGTVPERCARAAKAAADGCAATEALVATKGRASYLGERSRGHVDPGAASSALLLAALADALVQLDEEAGASR